MKAIKKHKSEIQKEKLKTRQGIIYKMFFQVHIIFYMVSWILNITVLTWCQIALLYVTMQEWIHPGGSVQNTVVPTKEIMERL